MAGELECAVADAGASDEHVAAASQLTLMLADAALGCGLPRRSSDGPSIARDGLLTLQQLGYGGSVSVGVPEGFAYYALHPLDYADLVERLELAQPRAFVIGIRSIGATLSAVSCAKLRQLGTDAERTTVRPTGHPYDRRCEFSAKQRQAIARALDGGAEFIICDEGPGRSGSSLLSVAEALEREGVPSQRILILSSHEPNVDALCAQDAARRWQRYRSAATGMTRRLPAAAQIYAGGGEWRRHLLGAEEDWPAVWPQMERLKYLSADHRELFIFEGHGQYGAAVSARHQELSDSGFGVTYLGSQSGFARHRLPTGRPARQRDLSPELLARVAQYCAWRARALGVANLNSEDLEEMTRVNFAREFDAELDDFELSVLYPTVCDNRMAWHHWLIDGDGCALKLDAAIHCDDHFFPGPCDIAWDLAGVILEWNLDSSARETFLGQYRRISGDDASSRVESYEVAYAMFRLAWSKMAGASVADSDEGQRLVRDYWRYRRMVETAFERVAPLTRL